MTMLAPLTIFGFLLFTGSWIVLGRVSTGFTLFGMRIEPYDWVAQPVSGLGLGDTAPAMNGAFVLTALLNGAGIVGIMASMSMLTDIQRTAIGGLLLLSPIGTALAGVFDLERFVLHFSGYLLAVGAPVAGFTILDFLLMDVPSHAVLGRVLIGAGGLTLVLLVVQMATFDPEASGRGIGIGGLTQRLLVTEVLGVFALLGCSVV